MLALRAPGNLSKFARSAQKLRRKTLKGYLGEAAATCKESIRLNPNDADTHNDLAYILLQRGDLDGAVAEYKEALRLNPKQSFSVEWLPIAEQMRELLPLLPDILAGRAEPKSPLEACEFARLCMQPFQRRFMDAVRLYEKAFANAPMLADDLIAKHRYSAACYAARAARREGKVAAIDPAECAVLRGKALAWLRASLAARTKQLNSGLPADRAEVQKELRRWRQDSDFAGIRDAAELAKLPAEEQKEFNQLWADAAALLKKAEEKKK